MRVAGSPQAPEMEVRRGATSWVKPSASRVSWAARRRAALTLAMAAARPQSWVGGRVSGSGELLYATVGKSMLILLTGCSATLRIKKTLPCRKVGCPGGGAHIGLHRT